MEWLTLVSLGRYSGLRGFHFFRFDAFRNSGNEYRSHSKFASDSQIASHEAANLPADREAQSRAGIAARRTGIHLREVAEKKTQVLLGDADTGILYLKVQSSPISPRAKPHRTLVCELAGIP